MVLFLFLFTSYTPLFDSVLVSDEAEEVRVVAVTFGLRMGSYMDDPFVLVLHLFIY